MKRKRENNIESNSSRVFDGATNDSFYAAGDVNNQLEIPVFDGRGLVRVVGTVLIEPTPQLRRCDFSWKNAPHNRARALLGGPGVAMRSGRTELKWNIAVTEIMEESADWKGAIETDCPSTWWDGTHSIHVRPTAISGENKAGNRNTCASRNAHQNFVVGVMMDCDRTDDGQVDWMVHEKDAGVAMAEPQLARRTDAGTNEKLRKPMASQFSYVHTYFLPDNSMCRSHNDQLNVDDHMSRMGCVRSAWDAAWLSFLTAPTERFRSDSREWEEDLVKEAIYEDLAGITPRTTAALRHVQLSGQKLASELGDELIRSGRYDSDKTTGDLHASKPTHHMSLEEDTSGMGKLSSRKAAPKRELDQCHGSRWWSG
ncbi:hypothetical protein BD410DRAFT_807517 [Rickenella mellea]|uniref:Uncharacterized protein n=1 Tax=Rickenella mellea TaxID=50990 RepID=A0A4Y7PQP0_9AGAM|nr:hypothetical protein BD410DRAFT_807517 [Rickenella mellea]